MTHEHPRQEHDRDRGFTLVELIMAVAILGIITATLGGVVYLALKSTSNNYSRLEQSNAEMVVTRYLTGDIHQAAKVEIPGSQSTRTGCVGTVRLAFEAYPEASATDPTTDILWVQTGTNELLRCEFPSNSLETITTVSSGITAFSATCRPDCAIADTIRVTFTAAGAGDVPARDVQIEIARRL